MYLCGKEYHSNNDDGVTYAAEVMYGDEVPERPGIAGMLQEHRASDLGHGWIFDRRWRIILTGAIRFLVYVGRVAVKQHDQGKDDDPAHHGDHHKSRLPFGAGEKQGQRRGHNRPPHAAPRLLEANGQPEPPAKPGGDCRGNVDLE